MHARVATAPAGSHGLSRWLLQTLGWDRGLFPARVDALESVGVRLPRPDAPSIHTPAPPRELSQSALAAAAGTPQSGGLFPTDSWSQMGGWRSPLGTRDHPCCGTLGSPLGAGGAALVLDCPGEGAGLAPPLWPIPEPRQPLAQRPVWSRAPVPSVEPGKPGR